jgi:hypothetical protein
MTEEYNDKLEAFDDGAFSVFQTRYGTYSSIDREGKALVSSISKEDVIAWSREHLNGFQNSTSSVTDIKVEDVVKL